MDITEPVSVQEVALVTSAWNSMAERCFSTIAPRNRVQEYALLIGTRWWWVLKK